MLVSNISTDSHEVMHYLPVDPNVDDVFVLLQTTRVLSPLAEPFEWWNVICIRPHLVQPLPLLITPEKH